MGALNSLATLGLNAAMAQGAGAKPDDKQLEQQRDQQTQELLARAAAERQGNEDALKRRLAQERARAGAAGVSDTGGSIDAVLQGLTQQSDAEQAAADSTLQTRLAALQSSFDARRRRGLLDGSNRWIDTGTRTLSALTGQRRGLLD